MSNHQFASIDINKTSAFGLTNRFATLYAALFTPKGRATKDTRDRVSAALNLHQMANDMDALQPSLAAELRAFASRS
ncbi:MAG: hypothetical protein NWS01_07425 [Burkholderiales bacterium]|nr:hypothetical protein [Burkholderiales bacterium]